MRGGPAVSLVAASIVLVATTHARPPRPRFEPTDLGLEDPGVIEMNTQFGASTGGNGRRIPVPDYELDIGLLPYLELDLDGAVSFVQTSGGPFQLGTEPLWTSVKLGLYDTAPPDPRPGDKASVGGSYAFGAQLGPRFPGTGMHGTGYGAVLLAGYATTKLHLAVNVGGLVDPAQQPGPKRPVGGLAGVDLELDVGSRPDRWSILGALAGAAYVAVYPNEATVGGGVAFAPDKRLKLSLVGLASPFAARDRVAILFGFAPSFAVFLATKARWGSVQGERLVREEPKAERLGRRLQSS